MRSKKPFDQAQDKPRQSPYEPLYDFPCSSTFRRYEDYWQTGRLYNELEPEPRESQPQEVIYRHSDMSADEARMLIEHDRALKYLLDKQREKDERQAKPQPRKIPPKTYTFEG